MIAVGDFVEIVNVPAQDLGKNGRTTAALTRCAAQAA